VVFGDVSDRIVGGAPFELTLDAQTVTEWIAARAEIWPDSQEWIPPWLRDPVVAFVPGRIILAGQFDRGGWESIVALHLAATVEDGEIVVRLAEVTCGSLPVPESVLRRPLNDLIQDERLEVIAMPDELAAVMRRLRSGDSGGLFDTGVHFAGPFIWKNGDRPYRIGAAEIGDGWLKLRIEPL